MKTEGVYESYEKYFKDSMTEKSVILTFFSNNVAWIFIFTVLIMQLFHFSSYIRLSMMKSKLCDIDVQIVCRISEFYNLHVWWMHLGL